ncbi:hypothetical protein HOLleu_04103 [Holothuria leucospilota]|uniref:Uncharacterized protein n=1 Tax=Holothuria leucospilota TaxID=206669 RepID=A0A9Q1HLP1_HOLLE|nr:hypothetical protein HOLleu_04103 [Holothuria leucospilota]
MQQQLCLSANTIVDWDMFCRECCDVIITEKSEKLGGENKRVQIDESKIGKRKYHRGHRVEGQWVFGGIEEDSSTCSTCFSYIITRITNYKINYVGETGTAFRLRFNIIIKNLYGITCPVFQWRNILTFLTIHLRI